ncbi:MAG: hypothetical protein M3Y41_06610 [Pseudomonadota bacterium]|nr:hypothetical protein [Pseudomonadota bacterium]
MSGLTRSAIAEQDRHMLERQANFRLAADMVTVAFARFVEVAAVALIGSVARPLWREVPRFSPFRRLEIPIWHECKDVDLALWLEQLDGLPALNRARGDAVRRLWGERQVGVAHHQVEVFILRAGSNDYLGRLCTFSQCPKGKRECLVPGCGRHLFLRQHDGFNFWPDALDEDRIMRLYERQRGVLRRAADTPATGRENHAATG